MTAADLVMPRMGATMTEGIVVRWLKQPGEAVQKDEPVLEIETDKSTVELGAPVDGVLGPWLAEVGQAVPVGGPLVIILAAPGASAAPADQSEVRASPVAKRAAREHGLDLAQLTGTGPGGRIIEEDVLRALAAQRPSVAAGPITPPLPAPPPTLSGPAAARREPVSGLRHVTAERMTHSFATAPHFYLHVEADASALAAWLSRLTRAVTEPAMTYTDLLLKLTAAALHEHPRVNAHWETGSIVYAPTINLGLAVATEKGLMVPVLRRAEQLTLREISRLRLELVERAQAGKLLPDDYADGTFTLTNLGMFRIDSFQAILNPPQCAILAVGRIKPRPFVVSGELAARPTLHFNLTADHRVLDGAEAAQFLGRLVELVETPSLLIE